MFPTLHVLCGLPGSGKSTYAKQALASLPVVSTDAIRGELWGDEADQQNPQEVFRVAFERVEKFLAEGQSCVFDATNLRARDRKSLIQRFSHTGAIFEAHFLNTPLRVALDRNAKRERVVPEYVIRRMARSRSTPRTEEGWSKVHIIPAE